MSDAENVAEHSSHVPAGSPGGAGCCQLAACSQRRAAASGGGGWAAAVVCAAAPSCGGPVRRRRVEAGRMSFRLMPGGMLARDGDLRLRDLLKKRPKPELDRARLLGAESRGACR